MSNDINKLFESIKSGEKNPGGIDTGKLMNIMSSSEGQQLINLLNSDGGAGLKKAAEAIQNGDANGVKTALQPLMDSRESEELMEKISGKLKE